MQRLVCVVEGHGEVAAMPVLCHRVMRSLLEVHDWFVDDNPVRVPRSQLVDESRPSPRRPPRTASVERALALAAARSPAGILVLCDADDDCPAALGGPFPRQSPRGAVPVRGVMASREFESWLLWSRPDHERAKVNAANPEVSPRAAKAALAKVIPGYAPSTHQLGAVRGMDLGAVWARSDSFDKLVRSIGELVGAARARPPLG